MTHTNLFWKTPIKQNLPAHGHLGFMPGLTKEDVRKKVRKIYVIPVGTKIIVNYSHRDSPSIVYEVEVIVPRKKKPVKK